MSLKRETRLQIMLDEAELTVIDDWRFKARMPSRAAAIRQLITLGLNSVGYRPNPSGMRSQDFGVSREADGEQAADGGKTSDAPQAQRLVSRDRRGK